MTVSIFNPAAFTVRKPKPLPVLLLLDMSSSMWGCIDILNTAVREMLNAFTEVEKMETLIQVGIITFGGQSASVVAEFTDASQMKAKWQDLSVTGCTPLGDALRKAKPMVEKLTRAYRPVVILLSDGAPTDAWRDPMDDFITNGKSSQCDRMAMAIGSGADRIMLKHFLKGTEHEVFDAGNASDITKFFRLVTTSTIMRTRSMNPNLIPSLSSINFDED